MTEADDHGCFLDRIEAASTAGAAIDAIPEDWRFFLSGPDETGFASALLPPDAGGAPERIYRRGLAMGTGPTRLEAVKAAATWLRDRLSSRTDAVKTGEEA